ncbi:hypothetical protein HK405_015578, partial [Cladochytrium tenue]
GASAAGASHPRLGSEASSATDSVDAPPAAVQHGLAVSLAPVREPPPLSVPRATKTTCVPATGLERVDLVS